VLKAWRRVSCVGLVVARFLDGRLASHCFRFLRLNGRLSLWGQVGWLQHRCLRGAWHKWRERLERRNAAFVAHHAAAWAWVRVFDR
jgi:hypothetical protein